MGGLLLSMGGAVVFTAIFSFIGFFFSLLVGVLLEWIPGWMAETVFTMAGGIFGLLSWIQIKRIAANPRYLVNRPNVNYKEKTIQ